MTFPADKQFHLWTLYADIENARKIGAKIALRTLRVVTPPQSSQVTNGAELFFCPVWTDVRHDAHEGGPLLALSGHPEVTHECLLSG